MQLGPRQLLAPHRQLSPSVDLVGYPGQASRVAEVLMA